MSLSISGSHVFPFTQCVVLTEVRQVWCVMLMKVADRCVVFTGVMARCVPWRQTCGVRRTGVSWTCVGKSA